MKVEKNQQILSAAKEEFIVKGLEGASMEGISLRAEVSKRTLYKYYRNKESLFTKLVDDLFEQVETKIQFRYSKEESLEDLLEDVIEAKIRLHTNRDFIKVSKILLSEQMKKGNVEMKLLAKLTGSYRPFKNWLKFCANDGKIKKSFSVDNISNYFHAMLEGMVFIPVIYGFRTSFTKEELSDIRKIIKHSFLSSFKQT